MFDINSTASKLKMELQQYASRNGGVINTNVIRSILQSMPPEGHAILSKAGFGDINTMSEETLARLATLAMNHIK